MKGVYKYVSMGVCMHVLSWLPTLEGSKFGILIDIDR